VLSTLLVPQGMADAELAGLPPITGQAGFIADLISKPTMIGYMRRRSSAWPTTGSA